MAKNVGVLFVDVKQVPETDGRLHFKAELASASYAACGLREFKGQGGFEHIYSDADTRVGAVAEIGRTLRGLGLTGKLRIRK